MRPMAGHQARLLLWNLADLLSQVGPALTADGVPADEAEELGRAAAMLLAAIRQAREASKVGAVAPRA